MDGCANGFPHSISLGVGGVRNKTSAEREGMGGGGSMCYLFCRCTRAVSVCPPAYYAHRAAMRGRQLVHGQLESDTASISSGGSGDSNLKV